MNQVQTVGLVEILDHVRRRPGMYIGKHDPDLLVHFLNGFRMAALAALGVGQEEWSAIYEEVVKRHRWEISGLHPYEQMLKRGIAPECVIEEMVIMEIESLQRLLRNCPQTTKGEGTLAK